MNKIIIGMLIAASCQALIDPLTGIIIEQNNASADKIDTVLDNQEQIKVTLAEVQIATESGIAIATEQDFLREDLELDNIGIDDITDIFDNYLSLGSEIDFGSFSGLFEVECYFDSPLPDLGDICKKLNFLGDIDTSFGFNIGGCSVDINNDALEKLNKQIEAYCKSILEDASDAVRQTKQDEVSKKDGNVISGKSEDNTVDSDGLHNQKYANGKTTKDIFKEKTGILSYETIRKKGNAQLKKELRGFANKSQNSAYVIAERQAKSANWNDADDFHDGLNSIQLSFDTELDYKQQVVAQSKVDIEETFQMSDYIEKTEALIDALKSSDNYRYNWYEKTSPEMQGEYTMVNRRILAKLLDTRNKDSLYKKSILKITAQTQKEYSREKELRKNNEGFLISPSNKKLKKLALEDKALYANRAYLQAKTESLEIKKYNVILKRRLAYLKLATKKCFYDSLEYQSIIIKTRIQEILSEGDENEKS